MDISNVQVHGVTMQIKVTGKNVYGEIKYYPKCRLAEQFADMLGQKTLTTKDLYNISKMEISVVFEGEDVVPNGWAFV